MTYALEKQIGQLIMDNAENLATLCTQDEDNKSNNNKNTTQHNMCWTHTNNVNKT
jgi:hypothetical protein